MLSHGFAPVARPDARVLVLGSLPGTMSLARAQYYAQPRNGFWRIMGELAGAGPELPYAERLARLMGRRIALWDVCATAFRPGALDSAIADDSIVPNDFLSFLPAHPAVARIAFNGAKAAEVYVRKVLPGLPEALRALDRVTLPSTSPAHAGMPYAEKLARWRSALG